MIFQNSATTKVNWCRVILQIQQWELWHKLKYTKHFLLECNSFFDQSSAKLSVTEKITDQKIEWQRPKEPNFWTYIQKDCKPCSWRVEGAVAKSVWPFVSELLSDQHACLAHTQRDPLYHSCCHISKFKWPFVSELWPVWPMIKLSDQTPRHIQVPLLSCFAENGFNSIANFCFGNMLHWKWF